MKRLLLLIGSLLLVTLCGQVLSLEEKGSTIPLFAWSSKSLFSKQNEQYLETLTVTDIEDSLQATLFQTGNKNFLKSQGTPESVVLFVEPQLQTDQIPHFGAAYATSANGGSFSSLKSIVETSPSSLVAPYVTAESQFSLLDATLARIARKLSNGNVLVIRQEGSPLFAALSRFGNVQTLSVNDLKADTFANGVPALVIVCLDVASNAEQFAAHDAVIKTINQAVAIGAHSNHLAIYTGNAASASTTQWTYNNIQTRSALYMNNYLVDPTNNTNITNSTEPRTYLTGPILEAFMVLLTLLTMLFVGICNLCSLQVPEQFETPKVQKQII